MIDELSMNDTTAHKLGVYYRQLLNEGLPDDVVRHLVAVLGDHMATEVGVDLVAAST